MNCMHWWAGLEQGVQESRLVRAHDTVRLGVNSPPEASQGVEIIE